MFGVFCFIKYGEVRLGARTVVCGTTNTSSILVHHPKYTEAWMRA